MTSRTNKGDSRFHMPLKPSTPINEPMISRIVPPLVRPGWRNSFVRRLDELERFGQCLR